MQSDPKDMSGPSAETCLSHLQLTDEQAQAASLSDGDALVLAGPGSGKTHTLRARILYLLAQGQDPGRLLVTSFSAQSAQSMRYLIQSDLAGAIPPNWIGTFHSLAGRLLRPVAPYFGLSSNFRILDSRDQKRLLAEHKLYWTDDDTELSDWFDRLKGDLLSPAQLAEQIEITADTELARQYRKILPLYETYQNCLQQIDAVDFSDLLRLSVAYLETEQDHPMACGFDHLIIDEYQDINQAQFRLIKALYHHKSQQDRCQIWAVGDDDQAIYGWRGSHPKWIREFQGFFPKADILRLQTSFRCPEIIAQSADSLISYNRLRHGKSLKSGTNHKGAIQIISAETAEVEASYLVHAVKQALKSGLRPQDIAILIRSSMRAFDIMRHLDFSGLAYRLVGAAPFWQHPAAKLAVGAMCLAVNPDDRSAQNMVGSGKRGKIIQEHCLNWRQKSPEQIMGYVIKLTERYWPRKGEKAEIWEEVMYNCEKIATASASIDEFVSHADQHRSQKQQQRGQDMITLTTIHAAKGLEWPMVVIAGCEDGIMPHILSDDEEEERRLFFVAMTRARNWLICTRAEQRHDRKNIDPSPFLSEMAEKKGDQYQHKTVFFSNKGELVVQKS